jgi:hypothetical protein
MNCYVCDVAGAATPAVAVCHLCGVALCRVHFDQDLLMPRPYGMMRRGCMHSPQHDASVRRKAERSESAGAVA